MIIQYDRRILGISSDNKSIFLAIYSGQIAWAQSLQNNSLITTFCTNNSLTQNNSTIKAWSKVFMDQIIEQLY